MKYEFNGITTDNEPNNSEFTELYENILILNKPFTVELEDDKEIELYLYIEDLDMSEYDDTTDHVISINVVPSFNSLSKEHQEDILGQYTQEDRESILSDNMGLLYDALTYGFNICLRSETITDIEQVEHKIQSAKAVYHAITGLIGFELDRYQNRIGNTGWDLLDEYCNDVDILQVALNRYNNKKKS